MKKISLVLNLVLIAIIVILAWRLITLQQSGNAGGDCRNKCDYHNGDVTGEISTEAITKLSAAYASDERKRMVTETHDSDALSLVFDMDKIKNFMWRIEAATCNVNCGNVKLGLRFYYIKYDKALIETIGDPQLTAAATDNYWKHSLAMVPVYYNEEDKAWYDFDYRVLDPKDKCRFGPPPTISKPGVGIIPNADNHGSLGPPPYPGVFPTVKN